MITDKRIANRIVMSFQDVRDYLVNAYQVDIAVIDEVLHEPESREEIAQAARVRSMAYYPGDRIARNRGWDDDPTFNPDDEDEEDEEEERS